MRVSTCGFLSTGCASRLVDSRNESTTKLELFAARFAQHQIADGDGGRFALVEHTVDLSGDRHFDTHAGRLVVHAAGRVIPLRHHVGAGENGIERFAACQPLTYAAVSPMP